jgi:hypothetical protein
MNQGPSPYYVSRARLRDELDDMANSGHSAFFKVPPGGEWRGVHDIEQRGKSWLCWLTSIPSPQLEPTGHTPGRTVHCHLWLAAHNLYTGGWRVATREEIEQELAAQKKRHEDEVQQQKDKVNRQNRAAIEAQQIVDQLNAKNAALVEANRLEREAIELAERRAALAGKVDK